MAIVGGIESNPEWQQIQEEITCAICGDLFCDPKTIPCLHTFCKKCLERSIAVNKKMALTVCCPLCRAPLPGDGLNFPTDFRIKRFIEIFSQRNVLEAEFSAAESHCHSVEAVHGCGMCEKDLPAITWCVDCQVSLCSSCDEIHTKWKDFKLHRTTAIKEYLQNPKKFIFSKPQPMHGTKELTGSDDDQMKSYNLKRRQQKKKLGNIKLTDLSKRKKPSLTNLPAENASDCPLFMAKYDYSSKLDNVLSFKKEDLFHVISNKGYWWYVKSKDSSNKGYIPSNYFIEFGSLDAQEWYFGPITEKDAEIILMQSVNPLGSFLIRDNETTPGNYFLSIKDTDQVKHYQIHGLSIGGFFITLRLTFKSIADLVSHYSQQADGLCMMLKCSAAGDKLPYLDPWEIDYSTIRFTKAVEVHQLSEVSEGVWNDTTPVAIHTPREDFMSDAKFLEEIKLMKQLQHPNIIKLLGACTRKKPMCIITELMKVGSLHAYLKKKANNLKETELINMGAQIASGMAYLESKNCSHRNLLARNILLTEEPTQGLICKVAIFCYARIILENNCIKTDKTEKFPIRWTAPESLKSGIFTIKSDVWSFGVVLYELFTYGQTPYAEILNKEVLKKLETGYRIPRPSICPEKLYEVMLECWRKDFETRPTFETLQWKLEDYYFSDYVEN